MFQEIVAESRPLKLFMSAIKSERTQYQYKYLLNRYLNHLGKLTYDDLLKDDPQTIQKNLEDYVMELGKHHTESAVRNQFSALFLFFAMNDVIINQIKLIKMFPIREQIGGGSAYSDKDIKSILNAIPTPKNRSRKIKRNVALVHFFAASGCRVRAISGLELKDLTRIENCYAVRVYARSMYEYTTFLTPEATKALDDYHGSLNEILKEKGEEPLSQDFPIFNMNFEMIKKTMQRILKRAGIRIKSENGLYDIPVHHGFRKRFNTVLKSNNDINPNLIEMMLGHSTTIPLDQSYLKPTMERLFQEYKKGIEGLTINKRASL